MAKTIKQRGSVLFSAIADFAKFNGQSTGKYELVLTLNDDQRADAESNGVGINVKDYQGQEQATAKFKSKFKLEKGMVVDRFKNPYVDAEGNIKEIPRGSEVVVFATSKPYSFAGKTGVTNYLNAIQIIEEANSIDFEDFSEELEVQDVEF